MCCVNETKFNIDWVWLQICANRSHNGSILREEEFCVRHLNVNRTYVLNVWKEGSILFEFSSYICYGRIWISVWRVLFWKSCENWTHLNISLWLMNCCVFYEKSSIKTTHFWPFEWEMQAVSVSDDWACFCFELGWFNSQESILILVISISAFDLWVCMELWLMSCY